MWGKMSKRRQPILGALCTLVGIECEVLQMVGLVLGQEVVDFMADGLVQNSSDFYIIQTFIRGLALQIDSWGSKLSSVIKESPESSLGM